MLKVLTIVGAIATERTLVGRTPVGARSQSPQHQTEMDVPWPINTYFDIRPPAFIDKSVGIHSAYDFQTPPPPPALVDN